MREFTIRRAASSDLDQITHLLATAELPLDGVREGLGEFQVAVAEGDLVGVAGLECYGRNGLVRSVAVADGWRGGGVAAALLQRLVEAGDALGIEALYLLTMSANGYFERHGFEEVPRSALPADLRGAAEGCGDCPAEAISMARYRHGRADA